MKEESFILHHCISLLYANRYENQNKALVGGCMVKNGHL